VQQLQGRDVTKKSKEEDLLPKESTLKFFPSRQDMTRDEYVAEVLVEGTATSAMTVAAYAKGTHGEVDLTEVFRALQADGRAVKAGDLAGVEAVLAAQVVALNVIFGELARRAALHMDEHLDAMDRNLRLAMKAQSQCRATAETLAIIKQGPAVYARQANIAHGPQQVNNSVQRPAAGPRPGGKTESVNPELLRANDGERLDIGATGKASGNNPALEAVGAKHRAEDAGR
jgi:hypothetical protein